MRTSRFRQYGVALQLLLTFVLFASMPLCLASGTGDDAAPVAADSSYLSKLPPLIDRELLFGDPKIAGAQISPDGKWISFLKPNHDVMNIWVKGLDESFDAARPITADTERPVTGYFWSRDAHFVLYVQDKGGDENFHVYALDPTAEAGPDGVPVARDLTPYENMRAMIDSLPKANPDTMLVAMNDRDPALHDMYKVSISTGARELLVQNDAGYASWTTDLSGTVRLAGKLREDGGSDILEVVPDGPDKVIYSCSFEESCGPIRFHKDGKRFYMISNKGDKVNLTRLLLFNLETGKTELVEADPEGEVDFGGPIFSKVTDELVGTAYIGDRTRIYPRTEQLKRDLKILKKKLPDGELGFSSSTADENLMIVGVGQDINPGAVYLYNRKKGKVKKLYDSRPELPTKSLAHMKPVRYLTRDGAKIPAYLTLPEGAPARNLPAILYVHGGPWARDNWGYEPLAQFLANRGYAVLQPNFRGSTGYGKKHLNDGNKTWGTGIMQNDISDGVKYLIDEGIADPHRIGILGGSYGGYATLAGTAFTPDLYAAGVSIVGPSNIISLLESIPPYWGPIKKIFLKRVGDPADPEDHKQLVAQSPFFHAKQIKAPLLVIQGANDPRVNKAESDQIVVALRDLKRPVEYMVAPDEGHGFRGKNNRIAMFAVIEEFLAEHLGGRYQKDGSKEIKDHIKSLLVDIDTVKMPQKAKGADDAKTAALPAVREGVTQALTQKLTTKLAIPGGQEMVIESERLLTSVQLGETAAWKLEAKSKTPMGDSVDVFHLDAKSLKPLRRSVKQGPISIDLSFSDEKIEGSAQTPNGTVPLNLTLEAPVFGSDAAFATVLSALPLAPGYQTSARTFDVQRQKTRLWKIAVAAEEKVTVPAGEFETFKVSRTPLDSEKDDATFWVTKTNPLMVVRFEAKIATPMGLILATGELQSFATP